MTGKEHNMLTHELWNIILLLCCIIVAYGYLHQGEKVRKSGNYDNVSVRLPLAVLAAQCILFSKGLFYSDWPLYIGAVVVNSAVLYELLQIFRIYWKKKISDKSTRISIRIGVTLGIFSAFLMNPAVMIVWIAVGLIFAGVLKAITGIEFLLGVAIYLVLLFLAFYYGIHHGNRKHNS
ncbi:MAG: hypothetical protein NT120_00555 [Candidatus Aenigmarchaeota archaeon]|nr:hypothetical protein [Candidatus Aenigmarchaeota archaeon]